MAMLPTEKTRGQGQRSPWTCMKKPKKTMNTKARGTASAPDANVMSDNEVFSPDAFVEGEDDQGCGGDRGDGSGIEGDVREGLEVLDQGVGPLGGSPH